VGVIGLESPVGSLSVQSGRIRGRSGRLPIWPPVDPAQFAGLAGRFVAWGGDNEQEGVESQPETGSAAAKTAVRCASCNKQLSKAMDQPIPERNLFVISAW
jgi:hypothetical protein